MGMSAVYTESGTDDAEAIRTSHRAIDMGVTLIDTAEVYGPYVNEELVGRALKGRRDDVVLATKFRMMSHTGKGPLDSSPENIRIAVESGRLDISSRWPMVVTTSPVADGLNLDKHF